MSRSNLIGVLGGALLGLGCASWSTLSERPEQYELYRKARVAPTQEERLRAADRYLREAPDGVHSKELRVWFARAEETYFLSAFDSLPHLHAYAEALPQGPHIENVTSRIAALEGRSEERRKRASAEDERIAATQAKLKQADAKRRAFVTTFKEWTARLTKIRSFGEPTSELNDETIFAFRLSEPRGRCQGDVCWKLLELGYDVPGERELSTLAAVLEVRLDLERGLLQRARLTGPALWTRLAEALSLRALPTPTPAERADAVRRSALLVQALFEPLLPAAACEVRAEPPVVVARKCRGIEARMVAGEDASEDDSIEIAPAPP